MPTYTVLVFGQSQAKAEEAGIRTWFEPRLNVTAFLVPADRSRKAIEIAGELLSNGAFVLGAFETDAKEKTLFEY